VVEHRRRCGWGTVLAAVALFATVLLTVPAGPATATASAEAPVAVIVRHTAGAGPAAEAQVRRLGGTVGRRLGIIDLDHVPGRPGGDRGR
jgi:hypothetical protein